LYDGVWAIEERPDGTRRLKIGDGARHWQELGYVDDTYLEGLPGKLAGISEALEQEAQARENADALLAPLESPGFSGKPETPQPEAQSNDAQVAPTKWVLDRIDEAISGGFPVPFQIDKGGTGAVTAAGARANLGAASPAEVAAAVGAAVTAEAEAREGADSAEAEAREEADAELDIKIQNIQGRGGYLTAHDFGTHTPAQSDLTDYALAEIGIANPAEIWNGTHVKNIYVDPETELPDGHVWALTNTPDTSPPIFEWVDDGPEGIGTATNNRMGVVKGTADPGDGSMDGFVGVNGDGSMKAIMVPRIVGEKKELLCRGSGQELVEKLGPYRVLPLTSEALITKTAISNTGTIRSLVPYMAGTGTKYYTNGLLLHLGSDMSYGQYAGKYKALVGWLKQTLATAGYGDSLYLTDGTHEDTTVTFDDATTGVMVVYDPIADDAVADDLYFVLPDGAGLFARGSGSQRKITEWEDGQGTSHTVVTLYDGKTIGAGGPDTVGPHTHSEASLANTAPLAHAGSSTGFYIAYQTTTEGINSGREGTETSPAWTAYVIGITY
jgi:hypothetical protein